jgi:alkanesulfonate monooxygenase SsuD/methylene tetrahydromethanopterin reductase-like flavin-dependent oxidoreductase (luciferase family)
MRFSLFYDLDGLSDKQVSELYGEIETQAIVADHLGFDAIWLAKQDGHLPSSLLALARISSLTRSIELGTTMMNPSSYHPLRLAEDIALLDLLSKGRARLAIGSGIVNACVDFTQNSALDSKTARMLEMLEVLRQAFDKGYVDFQGHYYQYKGVEIIPRPLQVAQQLLWVAAGNPTPELAGTAGYSLFFPRGVTTQDLRQCLVRYHTHLAGKLGFVAQMHFLFVTENEQEAQEQRRKIFARYARYKNSFVLDGQTEDNCDYTLALSQRLNIIIGTPAYVTEQLIAWRQTYGMNEIVCQISPTDMQRGDVLRTIKLLGQEVLPRLQSRPTSYSSERSRLSEIS